MKVLVTGGSGFAGRHLLRALEERGHTTAFTSSSGVVGGLRLRLPDEERALEVLEAVRPDSVVHLAAVSYARDADQDPAVAVAVNVDGTLGLLRALARHDPSGRVSFVFASTSQVYDARTLDGGEVVLTEESPLWPQNLYAATKLAAELGASGLLRAPARPAVIFRPFNHAGAGQRAALVLSGFARQIAAIELGKKEPVLQTGNLDVSRDFTSVRDIVLAYALAAEGRVPPGLYNLASGRAVPLRTIAEMLRGLSRAKFRIETAPEQLRPGEPITLRGSAAKLQSVSGWAPKISLEELLLEILNTWREHEKNG